MLSCCLIEREPFHRGTRNRRSPSLCPSAGRSTVTAPLRLSAELSGRANLSTRGEATRGDQSPREAKAPPFDSLPRFFRSHPPVQPPSQNSIGRHLTINFPTTANPTFVYHRPLVPCPPPFGFNRHSLPSMNPPLAARASQKMATNHRVVFPFLQKAVSLDGPVGIQSRRFLWPRRLAEYPAEALCLSCPDCACLLLLCDRSHSNDEGIPRHRYSAIYFDGACSGNGSEGAVAGIGGSSGHDGRTAHVSTRRTRRGLVCAEDQVVARNLLQGLQLRHCVRL